MNDLKTKAVDLASHVEEIAQTYYDLARVNMAQISARALSRAVIFFIIAGVWIVIIMLVAIGLSVLAGKLLHNAAAGYFVVALLYIVLLIIFYLLRKTLVFPFIRNLIVRKIYDKTDYQL